MAIRNLVHLPRKKISLTKVCILVCGEGRTCLCSNSVAVKGVFDSHPHYITRRMKVFTIKTTEDEIKCTNPSEAKLWSPPWVQSAAVH